MPPPLSLLFDIFLVCCLGPFSNSAAGPACSLCCFCVLCVCFLLSWLPAALALPQWHRLCFQELWSILRPGGCDLGADQHEGCLGSGPARFDGRFDGWLLRGPLSIVCLPLYCPVPCKFFWISSSFTHTLLSLSPSFKSRSKAASSVSLVKWEESWEEWVHRG